MVRRFLIALPLILFVAGCEQMAETAAVQAGPATAAAPITVTLEEPPPPPTSFTIYFALDSWLLNDAAEATVDQAIIAAVRRDAGGFTIAGHSDAVGAERQTIRVSKLRAQAVADALVFRGVPPDDMAVAWHGMEQPAVEAPVGGPEQANRRVTIDLR